MIGRLQGEIIEKQYSFRIAPGTNVLQLTLAWDDYPGTANAKRLHRRSP